MYSSLRPRRPGNVRIGDKEGPGAGPRRLPARLRRLRRVLGPRQRARRLRPIKVRKEHEVEDGAVSSERHKVRLPASERPQQPQRGL